MGRKKDGNDIKKNWGKMSCECTRYSRASSSPIRGSMVFGSRGRTGQGRRSSHIGGIWTDSRCRRGDVEGTREKHSRSGGAKGFKEGIKGGAKGCPVRLRYDLIWGHSRSAVSLDAALCFLPTSPPPPRSGREAWHDAAVSRALTFGSGLGALFAFLALDFLPPFFFTGVTCDSGAEETRRGEGGGAEESNQMSVRPYIRILVPS